MYPFGRSSRYHPNSPDAFLAAPFVQPTNFSITIPLSSSAPVVPEPAQGQDQQQYRIGGGRAQRIKRYFAEGHDQGSYQQVS